MDEKLSQYDVVVNIKIVKNNLRQRFDPEQLVELYNLIDQLEIPQKKSPETEK